MCSLCPAKAFQRGVRATPTVAPLGIDETAEWCNSFMLAPNPNGKVRLCLDPERQNQALIRPVHRGTTLNDIFPKLNNVYYHYL